MFRSTPPAPTCGAPSPFTVYLRPRLAMSADQAEAARRLKRQNPDLSAADIAGQLGATEADVLLALATIRTKNPRRSRVTLNATVEAGEFVGREAGNGEPRWKTVDRLLAELATLRAVVAGLSAAPRPKG